MRIITITHNAQAFISVLPNTSRAFPEPTLRNTDIDLKEREWDGVDWKHLAQDRAA
jgi:hypothetical protein